jgi:hypothetical protein
VRTDVYMPTVIILLLRHNQSNLSRYLSNYLYILSTSIKNTETGNHSKRGRVVDTFTITHTGSTISKKCTIAHSWQVIRYIVQYSSICCYYDDDIYAQIHTGRNKNTISILALPMITLLDLYVISPPQSDDGGRFKDKTMK